MSEAWMLQASGSSTAGAWSEFCDALKAAGSVVLDEATPADPLTRAEGWRYLTRLTRAAFETLIEASDPQAPELRRTAHETIKMGLDNPDNIYQSAPIHGRFRYRIHGSRGTVHYLGFGTQKGGYGSTGTLQTTGYLEGRDLEIGADGRFEIRRQCRSSSPGTGFAWSPRAGC